MRVGSLISELRSEPARAIVLARELVQRADICVENFKVGGLKKFGLDYESTSKTNPGLVYLSISGFGTDQGAKLPGYDLIVQAVSGLMSLTGEPDGPPYRAGISVFDVMAGLHGTIGVLAALNEKNRTGKGQHVEVNLLSSAMSGLVNQTAAYTLADVVRSRVYLSNASDMDAVGKAHGEIFGDIRPAATMLAGIQFINPAMLVEIEVDAWKRS